MCLTPNNTLIQDAVHTEEDYTLVLDNTNTIYQFSASPVIYNDNPSAAIDLSDISSLSFVDMNQDNSVHILSTVSFGGNRVLTISGEQGALLLQVNTNSLAVGGFLEPVSYTHLHLRVTIGIMALVTVRPANTMKPSLTCIKRAAEKRIEFYGNRES